MKLSDSEILKEIENGNIIVKPFERELLNPASLDIRLGNTVKMYERKWEEVDAMEDMPKIYLTQGKVKQEDWKYLYEVALDPKKPNPTVEIEIPEEGMILLPNEIYLYSALEYLGVKGNLGFSTGAKSSLGRLGLDIVIGPAGWADPGFEGSLVLELRVTRPLIVYAGMKIAQIFFEEIKGEILEPYDKKAGSKYHKQSGVQESLYHKNYNNES